MDLYDTLNKVALFLVLF